MRINKVKIKDGQVYIEYQKQTAKNGWDDFTLSSGDAPRRELKDALQNLAPHVVVLCELPESYENRIAVRSVSFSYSEAGVMGATITALMKLMKAGSPLNLNTPHKNEKQGGEAQSELLLPDKCALGLYNLIGECKRYIQGDRAQGELSLNNPAPVDPRRYRYLPSTGIDPVQPCVATSKAGGQDTVAEGLDKIAEENDIKEATSAEKPEETQAPAASTEDVPEKAKSETKAAENEMEPAETDKKLRKRGTKPAKKVMPEIKRTPQFGVGKGWKCKVCGCDDDHSCAGGCTWAEPNLCSKCAMMPRDGKIAFRTDKGAKVTVTAGEGTSEETLGAASESLQQVAGILGGE